MVSGITVTAFSVFMSSQPETAHALNLYLYICGIFPDSKTILLIRQWFGSSR